MNRLLSLALMLLPWCVLAQQTGPQLPHRVVENWPRLPSGWYLGEVAAVDVDADDNVWVFSRGAHPVIQFDESGEVLQVWSEFPVQEAHGLRVGPEGNIWTVDVSDHHVLKSTPQGNLLMILGRHAGDDIASFNRPANVAFGPGGEIYVGDGYVNSRVMKFSADGEFLLQWGTRGSGPGQFNLVHDVALDAEGLVYVADRLNRRVQVFDQNGRFVDQWTDLGQPHALYYVERENAFYICDANQRIIKVDTGGKVVGELSSFGKVPGKLDIAHYVAVDSKGAIYVAELNNWRVQKFAP